MRHKATATRPLALGAAIVMLLVAGCGSSGHGTVGSAPAAAPATIVVSSPDLRAGGVLPRRFTCDGAGARPRLRWSGVPSRAVEIAVVVDDPDAPGGTFVHWTAWGIPPSAHAIPPGAREGANSAGQTGWTRPCPPKGSPPHRYVFHVYALSRHLSLAAGAKPEQVESAVRGAAVARGSLTARYGR